jgi:hypothetical protein
VISHLTGSDLGVPRTSDYFVCEWREDDKRVVFSFSQKGNAMNAHFACGKESLRKVKTAIDDFCKWVFWGFPWCKMIFACTDRKSVERIVEKCGFEYLCQEDEGAVYVRYL